MDYKLIITERAEKLLDSLIQYLLYQKKNEQAARHLLDSMEQLYNRLEDNPLLFPYCKDAYLQHKGYRQAILPDMNYLVIYRVEENFIYILGIFHELEHYRGKF